MNTFFSKNLQNTDRKNTERLVTLDVSVIKVEFSGSEPASLVTALLCQSFCLYQLNLCSVMCVKNHFIKLSVVLSGLSFFCPFCRFNKKKLLKNIIINKARRSRDSKWSRSNLSSLIKHPLLCFCKSCCKWASLYSLLSKWWKPHFGRTPPLPSAC